MTSFRGFDQGNRDLQDAIERHVYGDTEYVKGAGSIVRVRGTGTEDQEVPVISTGFGFKLAKDSDAEVLVLGGGSDTALKFAIVQLPADKQREWAEGRSGVQNAIKPSHALEFRDGRLHLTEGSFTIGDGGTLDVRDGQVYIRGAVTITGPLTVNGGVITPKVTTGMDPNVPDPTK